MSKGKLIYLLFVVSIVFSTFIFQNCAKSICKHNTCNPENQKINLETQSSKIISVRYLDSTFANIEICYTTPNRNYLCIQWETNNQFKDEKPQLSKIEIKNKTSENISVLDNEDKIRYARGPDGTILNGPSNMIASYFKVDNSKKDNFFAITALEPSDLNSQLNKNANDKFLIDAFLAEDLQPILCIITSSPNIECRWLNGQFAKHIVLPFGCLSLSQNTENKTCTKTENKTQPNPINSDSDSYPDPDLIKNSNAQTDSQNSIQTAPRNFQQQIQPDDSDSKSKAITDETQPFEYTQLIGNWAKGISWNSSCFNKNDLQVMVLDASIFAEGKPCSLSSNSNYGNLRFQAQCQDAEKLPGQQCSQGDGANHYCTKIITWICE
jgi:hypothetical protein